MRNTRVSPPSKPTSLKSILKQTLAKSGPKPDRYLLSEKSSAKLHALAQGSGFAIDTLADAAISALAISLGKAIDERTGPLAKTRAFARAAAHQHDRLYPPTPTPED